jgi:hypothetical protein
MMDGLPQDMSEDDVSYLLLECFPSMSALLLTFSFSVQVSAELEQAYHITGLEEIRVIRDRQTS